MSQLRFGRKIPVPSTAEIKHEIRLMGAADALAAAATPDTFRDVLRSVADDLGLPEDRARRLVERFATTAA